MAKYKCTVCDYIYDTEIGIEPEIKPQRIESKIIFVTPTD